MAEYLHRQRVSATFFVVSEWSKDLSSDPGEGASVYETGHAYIRILGQLVGLGHRLGNHTLNHVLLGGIEPGQADLQVRANQQLLDPFLTNELRLFRAPGGAWSAAAASAISADPYLAGIIGPIRWDVDRKDWESSLSAAPNQPASDCESVEVSGPALARRTHVKPLVTARDTSIQSMRRSGASWLLHDRVGDVGSSYADRGRASPCSATEVARIRLRRASAGFLRARPP